MVKRPDRPEDIHRDPEFWRDIVADARHIGDERAQTDPEFAEYRRSFYEAASPVVAELRRLGFDVASPAELFNMRLDYRAAIPVLLKWLPLVENLDVKEDIVRALTVRWARSAAAPLMVEAFPAVHDPTGSGIRWAIANALAVVADASVFDELERFAKDRRYGTARQMLPQAIRTTGHPRRAEVLTDLLADPEVGGHAVSYDYTNDLSVRDVLEDVVPQPPRHCEPSWIAC